MSEALYKKCQQELVKMFERLIKKKSDLIDKCEMIDGKLYARCKLQRYDIVIMCDDPLEKRINAKIKSITGKKTRVRMHLNEAKQMTLIEPIIE